MPDITIDRITISRHVVIPKDELLEPLPVSVQEAVYKRWESNWQQAIALTFGVEAHMLRKPWQCHCRAIGLPSCCCIRP